MFLKITIIVIILLLVRLFIIKIVFPWYQDDLEDLQEEESPADFLEKMEKDAKRVAKERSDILKQADKKQSKIDNVNKTLNK